MAAVLAWPPAAQAKPLAVPPMTSRVVDLTNTLKATEAQALRQDIASLESETQAQLAVLIVPTTGQDSIEQYATRVFARWKLGRKEADDGVLLLVALKDRRMRIEVGTGLEGAVTDIQAARIIDQQMTPRFRNGDFAGGVQAAVQGLSQLIGGPMTVPPIEATEPSPVLDIGPEEAPRAGGGHVTAEGWALFGVLLWSIAVGTWYGRSVPDRASVRSARVERKRKGKPVRGRGQQRPEPWAEALQSIAPPAIKQKRDWRLTLGLLGAGPVAAAAALSSPFMVAFLAIPTVVAYGIGYLCGRSREVSYVLGGIALVIAALVGVAFAVGQERFWWGLLWAMGVGGACLFVGVIVLCMRNTWRRGFVGFAVRLAIVLGICAFMVSSSHPGPVPDETWIPAALATFLALLFAFLPYGGGGRGGGGSDDDSGWSSSSSSSSSDSSSSSSSSDSSSSGGSSSGGGASGSW